MFEEICQLFYMGEPPAEWQARVRKYFRPIFDCTWNRAENRYGYVMVRDGRIIGFLGAYHSTRLIQGRSQRFCNLTSWMVAEPHRNESLMLLAPILALKDHTITGLTPAKHVYSIYRRFQFADLETKVAIIPILSALPAGFRRCELTDNLQEIPQYLGDAERRLFTDHQGFDARHLLAYDEGGHCHLIYTLTQKRGFKMAYIHYLSDRVYFQAHVANVAWGLFLRHRAWFICVEDRHLSDPRPWLKKYYYLRVPRIFKSATVDRHDVDNLYTELIAANVFEPYFY